MAKARLVMPAIYRFHFNKFELQDVWYCCTSLKDIDEEKCPANKWGWHRASELMEAINNLLQLHGQPVMTAEEISEKFFSYYGLMLSSGERLDPIGENVITSKFVDNNGNLCSRDLRGRGIFPKSLTSDWFSELVREEAYLPAGIGTKILHAIQHPVMAKIGL